MCLSHKVRQTREKHTLPEISRFWQLLSLRVTHTPDLSENRHTPFSFLPFEVTLNSLTRTTYMCNFTTQAHTLVLIEGKLKCDMGTKKHAVIRDFKRNSISNISVNLTYSRLSLSVPASYAGVYIRTHSFWCSLCGQSMAEDKSNWRKSGSIILCIDFSCWVLQRERVVLSS